MQIYRLAMARLPMLYRYMRHSRSIQSISFSYLAIPGPRHCVGEVLVSPYTQAFEHQQIVSGLIDFPPSISRLDCLTIRPLVGSESLDESIPYWGATVLGNHPIKHHTKRAFHAFSHIGMQSTGKVAFVLIQLGGLNEVPLEFGQMPLGSFDMSKHIPHAMGGQTLRQFLDCPTVFQHLVSGRLGLVERLVDRSEERRVGDEC